MAYTDQQFAQLLQIIANSKLFSELAEQTVISNDSFFASINTGSEDAKKIKLPLLRGYSGDWNASTNTPTLVNGSGVSATVYRVAVAGDRDLGSGLITYGLDEIIYYNGVKWVKLIQSQISDIEGLQNALDNKLSAILGDSFYKDEEGVLRSNISAYKQFINYTSGTQVFTLDFEPTFFIGIFINGQYLDESDYIYTAPNELEILGTLESGDKIKILYEHFVIEPV
jgi:hypothetical protein